MTNATFSTILNKDIAPDTEKFLLQSAKLIQYAPNGILLRVCIHDGVFLEIRLEFSVPEWDRGTFCSMRATTYYEAFDGAKAIISKWEITKYLMLKGCVAPDWYDNNVQYILKFFEKMDLTDEDMEAAASL